MQSRALAAKILNRLFVDSLSLNYVLDSELSIISDTREKSFTRDLCFGVMRWYPQLDFFLQELLNKPIRKKNLKLRILCWLGLYQIAYQRTTDYGAVSATVAACDELSMSWGKGMVNAILRNFIRHKQELLAQSVDNEIANFAHPQWMIDAIRNDWPEHWQTILAENNRQPPMSLRTNQCKISCDEYQSLLTGNGHISYKMQHCENGLMLEKPCDISELPGFEQGLVSIQDGAAQLVVTLMDLAPGFRVLDACAAPGGKTCHMLEQEPQLQELVAIDIQAERLEKISQNLDRLSLNARTLLANTVETDKWWDGQFFDRILLDVPCTASGVIRRHPDIKFLRKPEEAVQINSLQDNLLASVWPLLASGGKLVYTTCSVLKRENDDIVSRFLNQFENAALDKIEADWGYETGFGRQILPGQDNLDGFYFTRLVKQPDDA